MRRLSKRSTPIPLTSVPTTYTSPYSTLAECLPAANVPFPPLQPKALVPTRFRELPIQSKNGWHLPNHSDQPPPSSPCKGKLELLRLLLVTPKVFWLSLIHSAANKLALSATPAHPFSKVTTTAATVLCEVALDVNVSYLGIDDPSPPPAGTDVYPSNSANPGNEEMVIPASLATPEFNHLLQVPEEPNGRNVLGDDPMEPAVGHESQPSSTSEPAHFFFSVKSTTHVLQQHTRPPLLATFVTKN